jgi:hypothetical protein
VMQWWVQIPFSMNENLFELYILVYKGKYDINMWKILRILTKPKSKIWDLKKSLWLLILIGTKKNEMFCFKNN